MSETSPKLSIVILNYNGIHFLKECIPSLLAQTFTDFEIIVSDNGSTDESLPYLKNLDKRITVIENGSNIGYGIGKNIGAEAALGEYVLLLDNDVRFDSPDLIKDLLANVPDNAGFVHILTVDEGRAETRHYGLFYGPYGVRYDMPEIPLTFFKAQDAFVPVGAPSGMNMIIKTSIWKELGGFDTNQTYNLDDMDVGARASIFGYTNYLYTKNHIVHLGIHNQSSNDVYARRFSLLFSGHARSMVKNYAPLNLLTHLPALFVFMCLKGVLHSVKRKSPRIFIAFFTSVRIFIVNLPSTIDERRIIQSKRVSGDTFLKVPMIKA